MKTLSERYENYARYIIAKSDCEMIRLPSGAKIDKCLLVNEKYATSFLKLMQDIQDDPNGAEICGAVLDKIDKEMKR
jgi:hypothetical protein